MEPAKRIMLVGGGSGGHFYPLMSLAEELRRSETNLLLYYMGPEPYDQRALEMYGITFVPYPAGKKRRYASFQNILDIFKTLWGIGVALVRLYVLYPDVIVSKGSYTSVPVVIAGGLLRIPIIVHESDTRPGYANKLGSFFARHVAISFEDARPYFKNKNITFTGIPMRSGLLESPEGDLHAKIGIPNDVPIILVLGGSQGAERLNQLVLESLDELLPNYTIIHQTGKSGFDVTVLSARELITTDSLLSRYRPVPFFDDVSLLNAAYTVASLIISRAGTGTLYEIGAHGKPSILIPIPESISHDQRENAYAFARSGAAVVLEEHNLSDNLLSQEIDRTMKNPTLYTEMSLRAFEFVPKDGATKLRDIVSTIAHTH